ncbi:hypothetical protein NHX12_027575 [Muraenolepis orangiensis]|uniref:Uncharacterized protein n=1 Tax=Muraenolepis orangiensis TaxID=630683 RepID=A0A9Q0INZ9_9TELE|nr:hypothetical protein NHX12_027575 [Muraenolepis orangiensis]
MEKISEDLGQPRPTWPLKQEGAGELWMRGINSRIRGWGGGAEEAQQEWASHISQAPVWSHAARRVSREGPEPHHIALPAAA